MSVLIFSRRRIGISLIALSLLAFYVIMTRSAKITLWQNQAKLWMVRIHLFTPVNQAEFQKNLKLVSEYRGRIQEFQLEWPNNKTVDLFIPQVAYPQGELLKLSTTAKTYSPLFRKSVNINFRLPIIPFVVGDANLTNVPTHGPITLRFSTPLDPDSAQVNIRSQTPGTLVPERSENKAPPDYSVWHFYPEKRLRNGQIYQIFLDPALTSQGGVQLKSERVIRFQTASQPKAIAIKPAPKQTQVKLHTTVVLEFDQELKGGWVHAPHTPGEIEIKSNKIIYHPHSLFSPDTIHQLFAQAVSAHGEPSEVISWEFSTLSVAKQIWVEVNLRNQRIHTVTVYKGTQPLRTMMASGGLPGQDTPLGVYYISDRGHSFWSPKYGEGAKYWVRFKGSYLFHSVPRDSHWRTIEEEHHKLGFPASHGCIRLSDEDAQWFFHNVPRGAMVVIYN